MPTLDIVDETFIVAPLAELLETLCDEAAWRALGLDLTCYEDRGDLGKRWTLSGRLSGTAEVWLEPGFDGVTVHVYLRADPVGRGNARRLRSRYARPVKRWVLDVKAGYDRARPAGVLSGSHGKIAEQIEPASTGFTEETSWPARPVTS